MDVNFNIDSAMKLLSEMNKYCSGIQKETQELISILKNTDNWNDNQKTTFQSNIYNIAKDLNNALRLESEYMRIFSERINELRG